MGLRTGYDRWADATEEGDTARRALAERQLAELRNTVDPAKLDDATRLSYQVFVSTEERRIARYRWRNHGYRFDKDGQHSSLPAFLMNTHRIESESDADAYIRRLEGIRPLFDASLARANVSAKLGVAAAALRVRLCQRGRRQHHQGQAIRRRPGRQPAARGFPRARSARSRSTRPGANR